MTLFPPAGARSAEAHAGHVLPPIVWRLPPGRTWQLLCVLRLHAGRECHRQESSSPGSQRPRPWWVASPAFDFWLVMEGCRYSHWWCVWHVWPLRCRVCQRRARVPVLHERWGVRFVCVQAARRVHPSPHCAQGECWEKRVALLQCLLKSQTRSSTPAKTQSTIEHDLVSLTERWPLEKHVLVKKRPTLAWRIELYLIQATGLDMAIDCVIQTRLCSVRHHRRCLPRSPCSPAASGVRPWMGWTRWWRAASCPSWAWGTGCSSVTLGPTAWEPPPATSRSRPSTTWSLLVTGKKVALPSLEKSCVLPDVGLHIELACVRPTQERTTQQ